MRCDPVGELTSCSDIAGATGSGAYTLVNADAGATLRIKVTATNGSGSTTIWSEPTEVITGGGGSPPVNTVAPVVSGSTVQGQVLSVSNGSWTGSPAPSFSYQWQRCDSGGANCVAIGAATGQTYTLAAADVGHTMVATVTGQNGSGTVPANSAASGLISASGGSGTFGVTSIGSLTDTGAGGYLDLSGPFAIGQTVTVSKLTAYLSGGAGVSKLRGVIYADNGGTPGALIGTSNELSIAAGAAAGWADLTFPSSLSLSAGSYWLGYWYADGVSRHYYVSAAGAERYAPAAYSSTNPAPASFGTASTSTSNYSIYASYTNGGGGSPPVNTVAPVVSGSTVQGQVLSVSNGSWTGSPAPSFSYQWQRCDSGGANCVAIGAATGQTYTLAAADVGHTMVATVTGQNGSGTVPANSAASGLISASGGSGTFGVTSIGSLTDTGAGGYLDLSGPFAIGQTVTVSKLTAYLSGGAGVSKLRGVIYADNGGTPGALIGTSNELSIAAGAAAGWADLTFPSSLSLSAGSYWLGYWYADGVSRHYYVSAAGAERYAPAAYSSTNPAPASFGTASPSTSNYSIYASYTNGGGGSPPVNTVAPVVSGSTVQGQVLSVSNGSWTGSPAPSFSYQWQRCDSGGANCVAIGAATGQTYTLAAADVGHTMVATVTGQNGSGTVPANSAASGLISASGGSGTFGVTSIGSLTDTGAGGYLDLSGPFAIGQTVTVSKLTAYLSGGAGVSKLRGVIYADNGGTPGALIGTSNELSIAAGAAAGWADLTFPSSLSLSAGSYWLGYWYADGVSRHYYVSAAGAERYAPAAYSSTNPAPASFGTASTSTSNYSIYASYTFP